MNLFDLIQNTGHALKRKTATEYAGPCPFCKEGTDRFIVTPDKDLYWCRQCGKTGDNIQFLRDVKGLTYQEACLQLGRKLKDRSWEPLRRSAETKNTWTPRATITPGEQWQQQAAAFLELTKRTLWHDQGKPARAWLHDRGLNDKTIKQARLGWYPGDIFHDREAWGLAPETNEKGNAKKLWTPAGLVIPLMEAGQVIRLRIRRADPGDGAPYVIVTGSNARPMNWGIEQKKFLIILESELDGLLVLQEAGDMAGIVALGSAQTRPDMATHKALEQANVILIALDTDEAGAKASWQWWAEHYRQAKRWPCINGKDPGEAYTNGLDIRAWTLAGLNIRDTVIKPFSEEWKQNFNYDQLERLAIMTVDAAMTDAQALAVLQQSKKNHAANAFWSIQEPRRRIVTVHIN
jgi:DNA primase